MSDNILGGRARPQFCEYTFITSVKRKENSLLHLRPPLTTASLAPCHCQRFKNNWETLLRRQHFGVLFQSLLLPQQCYFCLLRRHHFQCPPFSLVVLVLLPLWSDVPPLRVLETGMFRFMFLVLPASVEGCYPVSSCVHHFETRIGGIPIYRNKIKGNSSQSLVCLHPNSSSY